ncbi:MAG: tetratricopeptide repeat protein [Bdellovibrionales bacterium]|nr:tetratricopeptide repeat protein [Bdellovibrionales bacterium]
MKYFLYIFFFSVFFGCESVQKTVSDSGRQLEEAWLEGRSTLSNKLSSFTQKKSSQDDLQQSLDSIKERLDFLERNMVSKADVDSSIELLRRELSEIKKTIPKEEEQPVQKKTLLEQAEEHFNNEKWKQSIFAYEEFRKQNPQSDKFAEATLKIGLSFQKLELKEEAKVFLREVVDQFPRSKEADTAAKALEN